jgi:hypothetical protein
MEGMNGSGIAGLQLPQLPQLDKRDIEAVRNFLPGKVLGRTAALLSLVLLVLGFVGAVDWMLEQHLGVNLRSMPWVRAALLGGLPLLAVTTQAALEWRAERQGQRLRALAVEPGRVPVGYFRIGPYGGADRERFDRADEVQWKVLNWIRYTVNVPLYLTGDSGCGKSSLLNACVIPILREAGWTVVVTRVWQDPVEALRQALLRSHSAAAAEPRSLRAGLEAVAAAAGGDLLVVMDQFEEFVILSSDEARSRFVALLDDLRADPIAGLRLMLVLRSDYEALIEECGLPQLRQGDNHVFVGRFTLTAARSFMARSSLGLGNEQSVQLLATAAALDQTPGLIRPITLNVLGTLLSAGQPTAPSLDARLLIRRYIEQTIAQPVLRDRAPAVLDALITGYDTNRPMPELELVKATKLRRGEVRAVMNGMAAAGLVRPLDSEQAIWELSHDFVARAVARHLGRHRRVMLRRGIAYIAPALLALTIVGTGLVMAWQWVSLYQVRSDLAELGLTVTIESGSAEVEANSHLSPARFDASGPLLARLNSSTPITSVQLNAGMIASLEPLKSLSALSRLELAGTKVASLEPLQDLPHVHIVGTGTSAMPESVPEAERTRFTVYRAGRSLPAAW